MTRYAIGLGSNQGDRLDHMIRACEQIAAMVDQWEVSALYETDPMGGPDQDPFLNAVMVVETDLAPDELLDRLQSIEAAHGRRRTTRWGPRTLDLDMITSDGPARSDERLSIPHPHAVEREFVLRPLVELWPDAPVGAGQTAAEALSGVPGQGVDRLLSDWIRVPSPLRATLLVMGQFLIVAAVALLWALDGSLPDGDGSVFRVIGGGLAMLGAILAFISSRRLGSAITASPHPREETRLVISGPYRFARHPIYGGVVLIMAGTSLFLDSLWGLGGSLLLVPYLLAKAEYEERLLRMRFPGYRAYRAVVTRRLIPFVI